VLHEVNLRGLYLRVCILTVLNEHSPSFRSGIFFAFIFSFTLLLPFKLFSFYIKNSKEQLLCFVKFSIILAFSETGLRGLSS